MANLIAPSEKGKQPGIFWGIGLSYILMLLPPAVYLFYSASGAVGGPVAKQVVAGTLLLSSTVLWIAGYIPNIATSIYVLVCISMLSLGSTRDALEGLSSNSVLMFFAYSIIAYGMAESGLPRRIVFFLLRLANGKIRLVVLASFASVVLSVALIPIGLARVVMFYPIFSKLVSSLELRHDSNLMKGLMLGTGMLSTYCSTGIMTGATSSILAVDLFAKFAGIQWGYIDWLAVFFPAVVLYTLTLYVTVLRVIPPEVCDVGQVRDSLKVQWEALGVVSKREWKALLVIMGTIGATAFGGALGMTPVSSSLAGALLMLIPPLGVKDIREVMSSVEWSTIYFFGTILSLGDAVQRSGLMESMGKSLLQLCQSTHLNIEVIVVLMLVFIIFLRIPLPAATLFVGTLLPMAFIVAKSIGLNPVWFGMLAFQAGSTLIIFPNQSPSLVYAFQKTDLRLNEVGRVGIRVFLVMLVWMILISFLYWPSKGYSVWLP